jgi:hypothetical protein
LKNSIDNLNNKINGLGTNGASFNNIPEPNNVGHSEEQVMPTQDEPIAETNYLNASQQSFLESDSSNTGFFSKLNYTGSSVFGGINVEGNPTANLGLRWHYKIGSSSLSFMPETFFGFENPASFGLFANIVKELNIKGAKNFSPYLGLGDGFLKIKKNGTDVIKLTSNVVVGAHLFKVADGRFYVALSGRSFFKHNQFVAGY